MTEATQGFDTNRMVSWIAQQVELGARRPGSPAGHRNEEYLAGQLRTLGLESVRLEPIPITYWAAESASLEVESRAGLLPVECFPIPYTAFTGSVGLDARLVWAHPHQLRHRDDWTGAIVVTEVGFPELDVGMLQRFSLGQYDPDGTVGLVKHPATWVRLGWHLYRLAARRNAAGFIGIVKDQPGGTCRMYAPYGFREQDILDKPIPGLWVGKHDGPRLRELARSGQCRARLELTGVREPGVMHNVVGEIPGQSDETIVLSCHHDSPFESPVEDASGIAVVLALAEHFAKRRELQRRLVVLLTAGHFYGSLGTRTFIQRHQDDVVKHTAIEVTIEHIAQEAIENDTGQLVPTGHPEALGIFVPFNRTVADLVLRCVRDADLRRTVLLPAEGPLGDYPPTDGGDWWAAGVPVVNAISNPVYLLTADDAMHWVARDRLSPVTNAFAALIGHLDSVPRKELAAVDSRARLLLMKAVKNLVRARTTFFGLRPVY